MDQLSMAAGLVGYKNRARYEFRGNFLFDAIPLSGARVLEVGCGTGAWAIWAALHGASRVLGIEPEVAGSSEDTLGQFRRSVERLKLQAQVEAQSYSLDELPASAGPFDIVVMYNVINHLDEGAVEKLHENKDAFEHYVSLLGKLRSQMRPNGWLIVADCARDNFWPRVGLISPFARAIEWRKHQNPAVWIEVFRQAGFQDVDNRWSPLHPLPRFTGNWLVEYLTCSHFVLRFRPR